MEHRWFDKVVVLFWLATMTWLAVAKVLPPLNRGEPPSYRSIYVLQARDEPPVCWTMSWNDRPLGWAANHTIHTVSGTTEVHSRVHFAEVPMQEMVPPLLRSLVKPVVPTDSLSMDAISQLDLDPLGRLTSFSSSVRGEGFPTCRIEGTMDGQDLKWQVRAGEFTKKDRLTLPADALIGDEFAPHTRMPDLHIGQTWTVPVFDPMGISSTEVLHANVEGDELVAWNHEAVRCLLVTYRADSGVGSKAREAQRRLWVAADGMVIKQETTVLNSRLVFLRLSADEARALLDQVPAMD